jgi:hypothetical protein
MILNQKRVKYKGVKIHIEQNKVSSRSGAGKIGYLNVED